MNILGTVWTLYPLTHLLPERIEVAKIYGPFYILLAERNSLEYPFQKIKRPHVVAIICYHYNPKSKFSKI